MCDLGIIRISCYCKSSVTLPHGAVGLSAMFDCGISCSYSLTFCICAYVITCLMCISERAVNMKINIYI